MMFDCLKYDSRMCLNKIKSLVLITILSGCASNGSETLTSTNAVDLPKSYALAAQEDNGFADTLSILRQSYAADESGFMLIENNEEAMHWRLALVDRAKHSLDLQYYLWYSEDSGRILLKHVLQAAQRGVRIRIIVDDLLMIDKDHYLNVLVKHPNVEIRLFNAWQDRDDMAGRGVEFLQDMDRLNIRMHNKLMIADNTAVILGGRNIGDHYFGLAEAYNFHDLDVLGIGLVAVQASEIFDHFWNSNWVMQPVIQDATTSDESFETVIAELQVKIEQSERLDQFAIEPKDWCDDFAALPKKLVPGSSHVVFDHLAAAATEQTMMAPIWELLLSAKDEIVILNAYLIPSEAGIEKLKEITDRGVKVRILTNSLESSDVPAVNSHYKVWRKPILEAGAELYEIRADAEIQSLVVDTPPVEAGFMGLHSKAVVVDRQHIFIGSMNFDPRSININTEMGVMIDSPELGIELEQMITRLMQPQNSWQVLLDDDGDLYWRSSKGIENSQPAQNFWQRMQDVFFMMFPKELY
jgi:cardiolipin synthase C